MSAVHEYSVKRVSRIALDKPGWLDVVMYSSFSSSKLLGCRDAHHHLITSEMSHVNSQQVVATQEASVWAALPDSNSAGVTRIASVQSSNRSASLSGSKTGVHQEGAQGSTLANAQGASL